MRQRVETQTASRVPSPPPAEERPAGQLPLATPMPKQELKPVPAHATTVKMYPMKIAKAILAVTRQMQPVQKAGYNSFHKYNYPKWGDILEELGPLIADNGLIIVQSEIAHGGFERDLIEISYEFTIVNEDGDVWPDRPTITSICKVRDSKGVIDDKAASKCHTQAHKYALVQLFKIRTSDVVEHDANGDGRPQQQQQRRPVPSPSGKVAPHYIQGVEGETAQTWSVKFIDFIGKAETIEELEAWEQQNSKLLDLCQERDVATYNKIVDALEARAAAIKPKADPISSGKPAGGFPGDTKMVTAKPTADDLEIPEALRRNRKPTMKDLTDDERDWIKGLGGAFTGAEDLTSLAEEQQRLMTLHKDKVSAAAWTLASDLLDEHIERIQNGDH